MVIALHFLPLKHNVLRNQKAVKFTENTFDIQAHPEFITQDYTKRLRPDLLGSGKIDQNGKKLCQETVVLSVDSFKMAVPLKKFVSKQDN